MTYQQHYERYLESVMAKGGTEEAMNAAIDEMNALGNPNYRPTPRYKSWVGGVTINCGDCGDPFAPSGEPEVKSDALCPRCSKRKADAAD